jgi:peptidoglycan-associated lipoprotein
MLFKKVLSVAAVVVAVGFSAAGCTDDKKKTSEAVGTGGSGEPASPNEMKTVGGVTIGPVYFSFDDYTVTSSSQAQLTKMAEQLKTNSGTVLQIEGHCDERGSIEYNLALGERPLVDHQLRRRASGKRWPHGRVLAEKSPRRVQCHQTVV